MGIDQKFDKNYHLFPFLFRSLFPFLLLSSYTMYTMSIASLLGVRITSKICLLTTTLADKDNPSSVALLSDNLSNSQETFVEGRRVHF